MIVDVSYLEPFYQAEQRKTYHELLNYMISLNFDEFFYKKLGIYYEEYSTSNRTLYVPLSINFLLHYYYGKENNNINSLKYAWKILQKDTALMIRGYYQDQFMECKQYQNCQFKNYEALYGVEKANKIKKKISFSMSCLDKNIIKKRNASIQKYAMKRPESHNINISKGKIKKIIDTKTQIIYNSIKEASKKTGICITYIRECCKEKRKLNNYCFYYLKEFKEFTKDLI